jgi:outer membrane protein
MRALSIFLLWFWKMVFICMFFPLLVYAETITLAECILLGLENNSNIKISSEDLKISNALMRVHRARLLPTVKATFFEFARLKTGPSVRVQNNPSGTLNSLTGERVFVEESTRFPSTDRASYALNLSLDWTIFDPGNQWFGFRAVLLELQSAEYALIARKQAVVLAVKEQFFGLLLASERLGFRRVALDRAEVLLAQIRQGHSIGINTESEEMRAQLAVYAARTQVLHAEKDLNVAQVSLNAIVGLPLHRNFDPAPIQITFGFNSLDSLRFVASQKNARLNQIALLKTAADMRSTGARLSWLPKLSFSLDYLRENEFVSRVYDGWDENYRLQANLSLTYDLFKGGRGIADRDRSQAEANRQRHVLDAFKASLDREVAVRKIEIDRLLAVIKLAEQTVALGRKDLELAEKRHRLGLTDLRDLLESQKLFSEYQEAHSKILYDLRIGHSQILDLIRQ